MRRALAEDFPNGWRPFFPGMSTWSPQAGVTVLRSRVGGGDVIDNQLPEVVPGNLQLSWESNVDAGFLVHDAMEACDHPQR
jgi:hypothetical protein